MKNKKISKIGILVFCVVLCAIVGTAAIIEHFGSVTTTVNVERAISLTGDECSDNVCEVTPENSIVSGDIVQSALYEMKSNANIDVPVEIGNNCF